LEAGIIIVHLVGTDFLGETSQRRASRTAVEPDNERVVGRVSLRSDEHVMVVLAGSLNRDESREDIIPGEVLHLGQRVHSVLLDGSQGRRGEGRKG